MNAKEAKALSDKVVRKKQAAAEILFGKVKLQKEISLQEKIDGKVSYYLSQARAEASKGMNYLETPYPGDDMYEHIRSALKSKGYYVNTFTTDEGYCIGDVKHMSISW